jgi:hypothetical protein
MACRVIRGFVNGVKQNDRPEICGRNSNVIISGVLSLESVYLVAKGNGTSKTASKAAVFGSHCRRM